MNTTKAFLESGSAALMTLLVTVIASIASKEEAFPVRRPYSSSSRTAIRRSGGDHADPDEDDQQDQAGDEQVGQAVLAVRGVGRRRSREVAQVAADAGAPIKIEYLWCWVSYTSVGPSPACSCP